MRAPGFFGTFHPMSRWLYLLRHGRSEANELGLIASSVENAGGAFGLSPEGRSQIRSSVQAARADFLEPVSVLSSIKSMVGPDGEVVIMDERVGEVFTGDPDPVEQLMYGFSLICCLPDGRNAPTSVATGTVMRPPTLEKYASEAGFSSVEVLDIDHDFFRFYRLHQ